MSAMLTTQWLFTITRRRGREPDRRNSWKGYRGCLQADAYSVYDAFFRPERGVTEVGCWMHARRYFFKAAETDEQRMGPALHLIARLYAVEDRQSALAFGCAEVRVAAERIGPADRKT
jgi:hypothetical protein